MSQPSNSTNANHTVELDAETTQTAHRVAEKAGFSFSEFVPLLPTVFGDLLKVIETLLGGGTKP